MLITYPYKYLKLCCSLPQLGLRKLTTACVCLSSSIFMYRFRSACSLYSCLLANSKVFPTSSSSAILPFPNSGFHVSVSPDGLNYGNKSNFLLPRSYTSASASKISLAMENQLDDKDIHLLNSVEDKHGGVIVNMEKPIDSMVFSSLLEASISHWRQQGKKGVWIKLPIEFSNLVEAAVRAGFRYHHAEPDYLMLVRWIPNTVDTLPANASHRVGIGAFVMNTNKEVLVVQESNGRFSGTGFWKLPTGAVDEGEDICTAATREVKEETGIDTEFVEVLGFRQGHKSFFQKSDLFFVCMLQPHSFDIQRQASEIAAAKWMPIEDYAAQPFVRGNELFDLVTRICLAKLGGSYTGFSPLLTTSFSGRKTFLYFNNQNAGHFIAS